MIALTHLLIFSILIIFFPLVARQWILFYDEVLKERIEEWSTELEKQRATKVITKFGKFGRRPGEWLKSIGFSKGILDRARFSLSNHSQTLYLTTYLPTLTLEATIDLSGDDYQLKHITYCRAFKNDDALTAMIEDGILDKDIYFHLDNIDFS